MMDHQIEDDVDGAVRAAAGSAWARLPGGERAKLLYRLADLAGERAGDLARLQTREQGKPLRESAGLDLPLLTATLFSYAGWADKLAHAGLGPAPRPVGVVAALLPWTAPLTALGRAAAPALAAGATVVLKPAASTPATAHAFAGLCAEAGLPPGTVTVCAGGDGTGRALAGHAGVGAVAFAGSAAGARDMARALAGTGRPLAADVDGRAVGLVFDDAPLGSAVDGIVDGFTRNAGQGPCAASLLLVQEPVHDEVVAAVAKRLADLRVGDPADAATDLGPLHSPARAEAFRARRRAAVAAGADAWSPGRPLPDGDSFVEPVVLTGVAPSHPLAREEARGPLLAVLTFRTAEEAVALANGTPGLRGAALWTDKGSRQAWLARRLRAREVWVNGDARHDPATAGRAALAPYLRGTA